MSMSGQIFKKLLMDAAISKAIKQINVITILALDQNSMKITLNINIKYQNGQFLLWGTPL